jgi:hypothetical protein
MRLPLLCSAVALLAAFAGTGCAGNQPKPDYTDFRMSRPRSVLVLPPLNNSTDVRGTYGWLTTVTRPLAEMGYYVFPIAMVDQFLKENGLPGPGEMHEAPLDKYAQVFGTDSVLYVTLEQYGTKYKLLASATSVQLKAALVDARTGVTLWTGQAFAQQSGSGNSGGGLLGMLVEAAITQVVDNSSDRAHGLSRLANNCLIAGGTGGAGSPAQCFGGHAVLYGPYRPESEAQYEMLARQAVSSGTATASAGVSAPAAAPGKPAPAVEEEVLRADWRKITASSNLRVYLSGGDVLLGAMRDFDGEYLWLTLGGGRRKAVRASEIARVAVVR